MSPRKKTGPVAVAARTADTVVQDETPEAAEECFRKTFVTPNRDPFAGWDDVHPGNFAATAREALNRGLHPTGEAQFDRVSAHPDGQSVVLHYSVPVSPVPVG